MKIVQGFVNIAAYISNVPGEIAAIGELSTHSRTYSKEKGDYISGNFPGYQLITFASLIHDTGLPVELPQTQVEEIFDVVRTAMNYAQTHTLPYSVNDLMLTLEQDNKLVARELSVGEVVYYKNVGLPARLSWKSINHGDSEINIWLSDEAFADQYAGYDITVIPPLTALDDFFKPYSQVTQLLDEVSITDIGARIQAAKDRHPETVVRLMEFEFVNRYDRAVKRKTTWGILVYGKEGDYDDAIKDAITEWLVNNSSYNYDQWEVIFPDIFKRTEMIVIPRWDKMAVQNYSDLSSLFSSILNVKEAVTFAKSMINFYDQSHTDTQTYITYHPYKTIALTVTNGNNNADGKKDFKQVYWDYLPVPSTSNDFARQHLPTQRFSLFLSEILMMAETATTITPLPIGFRRLSRGGVFFIASIHNGINFLVAAKNNTPFRNGTIGY